MHCKQLYRVLIEVAESGKYADPNGWRSTLETEPLFFSGKELLFYTTSTGTNLLPLGKGNKVEKTGLLKMNNCFNWCYLYTGPDKKRRKKGVGR
jgi:hypothetical protein